MLASVAIPVSSFSIATLPLYGLILKWGVSVVFIANVVHWVSCVRAIPLAITVNELHVFLSSQPWNKKENARSIRQALYTHLYFPRGFRSC